MFSSRQMFFRMTPMPASVSSMEIFIGNSMKQQHLQNNADNPYLSSTLDATSDLRLGKWLTIYSVAYLVFVPILSIVMIAVLNEESSLWEQGLRTIIFALMAFAIWRGVNSARIFAALFSLLLTSLMIFVTIRRGPQFTAAYISSCVIMIGGGLAGVALLHPAAKRFVAQQKSRKNRHKI
ncbi:MAG: hypothetical protein ABL888_07430 [Pirellulaceae bacterium]